MQCVSDRIPYIILKGKLHDFVIVNVHGPTEDKDDRMKEVLHYSMGVQRDLNSERVF